MKLSKLQRNKRTEAAKRKRAEQRNRTELNRANRLRNRLRISPRDLQTLQAMQRRNISP